MLNELFQVEAIIDKLSSMCKDLKNYLKHKRKDLKLEDLIVKLWIEEYNRNTKNSKSKYTILEWRSKTRPIYQNQAVDTKESVITMMSNQENPRSSKDIAISVAN